MSRSSGGGRRSSGGFGAGRSSGGFSMNGHRSSRMANHSSKHYHHHTYIPIRPFGNRYYGYGGNYGNIGATAILITIGVVLIMIFSLFSMGNSSSSVAKNTTERIPLSNIVTKTDWYHDELGWIRSENQLIEGLEHFYNKTGVQPYVMLISYSDDYWTNGTFNSTNAINYLNQVYQDKFSDEGHFIFAYFSCLNDSESEMNGEFRYLSGYAVDTIMDNEACNIFEGYYEENYYNTSLSTEELISQTFSDTADSIMSRPTNFWDFAKIGIIVIAAIVIIIVVYKLYKAKVKHEKEKEEYVKDILDKPLETFGEDTSELEEKYK